MLSGVEDAKNENKLYNIWPLAFFMQTVKCSFQTSLSDRMIPLVLSRSGSYQLSLVVRKTVFGVSDTNRATFI